MSPLPLRTSTAMRQVGGNGPFTPAGGDWLPRTSPGSTNAPATETAMTAARGGSVCGGRRLEPLRQVIGKIDVSWRTQVVARDEQCGQLPRTLVGNPLPGRASQQDGMPSGPAVGRGHDLRAALAPHL